MLLPTRKTGLRWRATRAPRWVAIQLGREKISLPFLRAQLAARKAINSLMAYRAPKESNVLVDATTELNRIEVKILIEQVSLSWKRNIVSFQNSLIGCSSGIILPNDLVANVLFADEFENGLKEVDIQAQVLVDALQDSILRITVQSIIANGMAYHGPILLFDMGLIVFLVGTRTCEGDLLIQAIVIEQVIDEFGAIIGVNSKQIEGQIWPHGSDRAANRLLAAPTQSNWLSPASTQVGAGQGVQEWSYGRVSTMCHQVYFQKAGFVFVPVSKGTHRDVLFEQAARFGGTQARRVVEACRRKTTINAGTADVQE